MAMYVSFGSRTISFNVCYIGAVLHLASTFGMRKNERKADLHEAFLRLHPTFNGSTIIDYLELKEVLVDEGIVQRFVETLAEVRTFLSGFEGDIPLDALDSWFRYDKGGLFYQASPESRARQCC